jgi:hypothetical protein
MLCIKQAKLNNQKRIQPKKKKKKVKDQNFTLSSQEYSFRAIV